MARPLPTEGPSDLIVARATAPGAGAIAIVRASGPGAHGLAGAIFNPKGGALDPRDPGRMVLGTFHRDGERIDEGLAVVWKGPRSFTGEDQAEFHLHGSPVTVGRVIDACLAHGARLARPGEFTRRAYTNGKLDLAQAEAVCDLIQAETEAAGRAALRQLDGGLSRKLDDVRESLVPVIAELEARTDFPEEGIEPAERERLARQVDAALREIEALHDSSARGRRVRDGATLVLAGRPNAGKSSLFNLVVRRERALVTPHPGTTRDTVEAEVDLAGVPLTLVDTAGLRENPEEVEALGIERTRDAIKGADLVLFLVDAHEGAGPSLAEYAAIRSVPHFVVANKTDLDWAEPKEKLAARLNGPGRRRFITLSAQTRTGFEELESALVAFFGGAGSGDGGLLVTRQRHVAALERAIRALQTVEEGLASELSPEFLVVDLTEAVDALDSITGRSGLDEDVLDAIFSTFCLGK